jgi:phage terminase small subunit
MPVLKNARHERFAQELAKGKSATEAYVLAGYEVDAKSANEAGSRLSRNVKVEKRVKELLDKAEKRTLVSIESITAELDEARQHALKDPKGAAAAVSASMGKAKLHKLLEEEKVSPAVAVTVIIGTRDAGVL